jgi:uncharacterized protein YecT (DUF1311 family)
MAIFITSTPRASDILFEFDGKLGHVVLFSTACIDKDVIRTDPSMKFAVAKARPNSSPIFGCWTYNTRGNPVIAWGGVGMEEFNGLFLSQTELEQMRRQPSNRYITSFNCDKAINTVEKTICTDERLASLDIQLHDVFTNAFNASINKKKLKQEEVEWVIRRNKCNTKQCITDHYNKRISELNDTVIQHRQSKTIRVIKWNSSGNKVILTDDKCLLKDFQINDWMTAYDAIHFDTTNGSPSPIRACWIKSTQDKEHIVICNEHILNKFDCHAFNKSDIEYIK